MRDVTVNAGDSDHGKQIVDAVRALPGVDVQSVSDRTFLLHLGGKIEVVSKSPIRTRDDLSMAYTPGVARVCLAIADAPERAWSLTIKRNTVAVVSDGTAVLGLGDIGPEAAMPVMEGKAMLFKEFGGVDAFPICLATKDVDEIVRTVKALAPGFGGINLEDISAPRCFEIERRLREELDIPVFHDDQHGTAVVVLAAFLNSLRLVGKRPEDVKVVMVGAGAAGVACTKMLLAAGVRADRRRRPGGRHPPRPQRPRRDEAVVRRQHEPGRLHRHGRRGAARGRRLHRPVRPRRRLRGRGARAWRTTRSSSRWRTRRPRCRRRTSPGAWP